MSDREEKRRDLAKTAAMPPELCQRLTVAIPALHRFALGLTKDRDDAADLVQDTSLRALAFWYQWRPESSFENWLFQIARNLWIDRIRTQQSRTRTVEAAEQVGTGCVDGQRIVDQRLTLGTVRDILSKLPREQQEILLSIAVDGLSYKETSVQLKTPIGTVMSRLSRARRTITKELGGSLSTGLILALLWPSLDRSARADESLQSQPTDATEPRGAALAGWVSETLQRALAALTRELGPGPKGLQRAEIAASLFLLLLVDVAVSAEGDHGQFRGLLDEAFGDTEETSSFDRALLSNGETFAHEHHEPHGAGTQTTAVDRSTGSSDLDLELSLQAHTLPSLVATDALPAVGSADSWQIAETDTPQVMEGVEDGEPDATDVTPNSLRMEGFAEIRTDFIYAVADGLSAQGQLSVRSAGIPRALAHLLDQDLAGQTLPDVFADFAAGMSQDGMLLPAVRGAMGGALTGLVQDLLAPDEADVVLTLATARQAFLQRDGVERAFEGRSIAIEELIDFEGAGGDSFELPGSGPAGLLARALQDGGPQQHLADAASILDQLEIPGDVQVDVS